MLFADQVAEGLAAIRAEGIAPVSPTPMPSGWTPHLLRLPDAMFATLLRGVHPSQVPHALEMVSIRVAFAKAGVLHSWKSDLEIASKNLVLENGAAKDFDAVAGIEVDGKSRTIGIEYERNPKAAARYRAIREVFERDETTDAVLYLTPN